MSDRFPTPAMESYFHTLPLNVQEQIMQIGIHFNSEEDMRAVAMQLIQRYGVS